VAAPAVQFDAGIAWPRPSQRDLVLAGLAAILLLLAGLPLLALLLTSLKREGAFPFDSNPLTLQHYVEVYLDPATYRLLLNTVLYAIFSLALGVVIASGIAWLVERTDMPYANSVYALMFVPISAPPIVLAIGWVLLLNPQNGVVNMYLRQITGFAGRGPIDVYTLAGMVIITGLAVVPSMFLMLSSLMRNLDPSLEEAGQMSGGSFVAIMRRITAPLMLPGLLSVLIYFAIVMIEFFDIPLVIGLTGGARVLASQVYLATRGESSQSTHGIAATYAVVGLVLGALLIMLYTRATRQSRRFAVVGGKAYRPRKLALGAWRYVAFGGIVAYLLLDVGLPFLILLWSSFQRFYQLPSLKALSQASLERYKLVFVGDSRFPAILLHTLLLVVAAATVCMALASLVAWLVVRSDSPAARWLDTLAFLPTAMPGVLLAFALLMVAVGTPIYGTVWIIVLGHVIRFLPFGARSMRASMVQIQNELEEAGLVSGAGPLTVLRRIVMPILKPTLVNGWLWVTSHSMRDLTFPLLLSSAGNTVIGTLLWEYWSQSQIPEASALAVVLAVAIVLIVLPVRLFATNAASGRP
jgi:iron(III) transport system permease protein